MDAAIVGKFVGTNALASVGGSVGHILNVMVGFFIAMTSGSAVIVAHFYGSGDLDQVGRAARTGFSICNIIGFAVSALGYIFARPMLELMNTPSVTIDGSTVYLKCCFAAAWAVMIYNMGAGVLRASGDSRRPFFYLACCCVANIVLDLVFVVGMGMGVFGAALATAISQFVSAGMVLFRMYTARESYRLVFRPFYIDRLILKKMMGIGLPSGFQSSMYSISNMLVQIGINSLGPLTVAGWTLMGKLDGFYWAIMTAVGTSVINFVGQNFGAGDYERIKLSVRVSLKIFMIFTLVIMGVFLGFSRVLLHLFTDDQALIDITAHMLLFFVPFYVVWTCIEIFSGALRGAGDARVPVIIIGLCTCLFRVIWVFTVFRMIPTLDCLCWCYPVTWVITGASLFVRYKNEKWNPNRRPASR